MSTWLVTGGAGFIGSNFVRHLRSVVAADIVILDALTYAGNLGNIADLIDDPRITFVQGDIRDYATLQSLFERFDFSHIVHFAAESHVDRSILGPRAFIDTNVNGTLNLLIAAQHAWKNYGHGRRFIHVSTDEVYGSLSPGDPPFDEQTAYAPNSPYSSSKAAADHLVRAWHHTYGLPTIITNCSNNFGPWQFPEKLIPLVILNAIENKELPIYGDGMQIRDWLFVQDHCEALWTVISRGTPGETYCIGGNNEQTNIGLVHHICDLVDSHTARPAGTSRKLIRHVQDRAGHDRRYAINTGKMLREFGWQPRHKFDSTLSAVVDWYLHHMEWIDRIRTGEYKTFYAAQYAARLDATS
jgi:dTDP-glucose 4,6-dehydratase